jgi:hypothetical protein
MLLATLRCFPMPQSLSQVSRAETYLNAFALFFMGWHSAVRIRLIYRRSENSSFFSWVDDLLPNTSDDTAKRQQRPTYIPVSVVKKTCEARPS